jgi:hypothetical protein
MRRLQAILAIAVLLALPLAPLAWSMACEASAAPMMCCLPHGAHSQGGKPMYCHCAGKSQSHPPDVGLVAPIPPVTISALAKILAPADARVSLSAFSQSGAAGFLSAPFEPPRA